MVRTNGLTKDFIPIKRMNKYAYLVQWDLTPNDDGTASWMQEVITHKPDKQELKRLFDGHYNEVTDNKILSGFVWREMPVWLSSENQFNYKAAYDLAVQTNGASLPVLFKFGTTEEPVYYWFRTLEDISDFYLSAMGHISAALEDGWQKKDNVDWRFYEEILRVS